MIRTLRLSLSAATVDALKGQNAALYAFQAVRYGPRLQPARAKAARPAGYGGGWPVVWARVSDYLANTSIAWDDAPSAYMSTTPLSDNVTITIGDQAPVGLGQKITVNDAGLGPVAQGNESGVVSLVSAATTALTCGLSLTAAGGVATPICAFPLYPSAMDMIAPAGRILVMFALDQAKVGMTITGAYASGLMVDFGAETDRQVSFDILAGWSAQGAAWAKTVVADSDLAPLLILPANA